MKRTLLVAAMAALSFAMAAIPAHAGLTANQLAAITPTNALEKITPPGAAKAKASPLIPRRPAANRRS